MRKDKLKDAVHIQNEYQRVAAPILEKIKEISKLFIGKKIDTLRGLTAKYSEALNQVSSAEFRKAIQVKPLDGAKWANVDRILFYNSYNDLRVEIGLCFSYGDTGCEYETHSWYFGKTENGILMSVKDDCFIEVRPLDYQQELAAIKNFRIFEEQMERAKDKIRVSSDVYKYMR